MQNKKIIDLFCGVGGLSLGFEDEGFEVELALDKWEDAIKTYNYNKDKEVAKCMDIHDISDEYLESLKGVVTGVIGGPPCQGFSTVGTRNINDDRNHLYKEYCRVVEKVEPEFFVIENVRGILTLGGGFFKEDIETRFSKLGYKISSKLLNSKDFGVPQSRDRVFFVGIKDKEFDFNKLEVQEKISTYDAISDLPTLKNINEKIEKYSYKKINNLTDYQRLMMKGSEGIFNHLPTNHTEKTKEIISMIQDGGSIKDLPEEFWGIRKYNKAFQRMNSSLPSHTVDTGHRNYFHYKENRVPSVRENARLQSFPDSFIFTGSKTSQYKQVGNAVPPLLGKVIAKEIKKHI